MKRLKWLVLILLTAGYVAGARVCDAQQAPCPWLNAATAGGFLGGDVQSSVLAVTADGDATCEFTRTVNSTTSMLRIAVHTMAHPPQEFPAYLASCANGLSLKGIGNQAVECIPGSGAARGEELIIGRVRERAFIITIKADWIRSPRTSPTKTRNPISDDSENLAEQVAGSLF